MRTLELTQGSPEWRAHRANHHNSSEAPAMMGVSPYLKRSDLIRLTATAGEREVDERTQKLFDRGHEAEALGRPIAERLIGEELFPATATSDEHPHLSASFDGVTMDERTCFECKLWNESKAALVRAGTVPPEDYWQCVQQLVVSRAERLVYMVTDGTEERTVHCELRLTAEDEKHLLDGWKQFDADVAAYQHEPVAAEVVGRAPEALPALLVQVTGSVLASNLPLFKERALEVFRAIKTDLQTDNDFADAEQTVKFCKNIEERLDQAKQHALAQTASIDELFRAIDDISAEARAKRLELDKLVKNRKEQVRLDIIRAGERALLEHVATLDQRIRSRGARVSMPQLAANFAGCIKGLKTLASIKDAVSTELARLKIEANALADRMDANLRTLQELAAGYETLFPDTQQLALKDGADLTATIKARIADHEAEQKRRSEAAAKPNQTAQIMRDSTPPSPEPPAKPRMRADGPTTEQIIALVASHYRATQQTAQGWLSRMDFKGARVPNEIAA